MIITETKMKNLQIYQQINILFIFSTLKDKI